MFDSFSELIKEFYRNGSPTQAVDCRKVNDLKDFRIQMDVKHSQLNPFGGTVRFRAPRNWFGSMFDSFCVLMKKFYRNGSPVEAVDYTKVNDLKEFGVRRAVNQ